MVSDGNIALTLIGLLLAGWMGAAGWAVWTGLALRRRASRSLRQTSRLGRLLETAPAVPLVVRSDGKADMPDRLRQWLGLRGEVQYLSDLGGKDNEGLTAEDTQALGSDVRAAQRTGQSFSRAVRLASSDRALMVHGGLADPQLYPNNAALLWFFDATESQNELSLLRNETREAKSAFDSLARLIERAPIPMWYRADNLRLSMVNSAFVKAVGARDADQVIAEGLELVESAGNDSPLSAAARAKDENAAIERMIPATIGGQRRQMRVVDLPLGNGGVAGFAIDEQELADLRGAFSAFADAQRSMLDALSSAVAQFAPDQGLVFANLPFRRLFSVVEAEDLAGTEFNRLFDKMRDAGRLPEVRDYPAWRAERVAWFRSPEVVEESWHLPDGSHLRIIAQPSPDGGLLMIAEDRTEQVQLARARDTLLRVRTATFDNLFEAVAVLGPDGRFSLWNRKFTDVWSAGDDALDGHPRLDSFLQKMSAQLKKSGHVTVILERVRAANSLRKQKGGQIDFADGRVFQFAAIPLPDGNILFAMLDISDRQRIEVALRERNEALVEADAIKGDFLSNMAYELRTPLTSIGGFAELLAAGIGGQLPDQAREYVQAILDASGRLTGQIDTVLDFSQSEAGALPIAKVPTDLKLLIAELTDQYRDAADAAQIDLRIDCRESVGQAACDPKRLKQALGHLIENAIRYTPAGGAVLVYGDGRVHTARIVISDNGPGMDNRMQARVFDRFTRTQRGEVGGGLGLPLARQLVEAHGGTLALLSEEGEGTVVTIELPRA